LFDDDDSDASSDDDEDGRGELKGRARWLKKVVAAKSQEEEGKKRATTFYFPFTQIPRYHPINLFLYVLCNIQCFFSSRDREKKKLRDQKALEKKRARLEDNANKVKGPAWTGITPPLSPPTPLHVIQCTYTHLMLR